MRNFKFFEKFADNEYVSRINTREVKIVKKVFAIFCLISILLLGTVSFAATAKLSNKSVRWKNPKYIKTYIPTNHRHTPMMKRAFAEWSRKTNNKIIFKYTATKTSADITVRYVKNIQNCGETNNAIGCAKSTYYYCTKDSCLFRHVYIDIADQTVNGRDLTPKVEIYTTMLHEIGHSIGLGHNDENKYSIMSTVPYRSVLKQEIDAQDLKTLAEIYEW